MDELTREERSGERKRADALDFAARWVQALDTLRPGALPFADSFWRGTFEPRIEGRGYTFAVDPRPAQPAPTTRRARPFDLPLVSSGAGVYRNENGGYAVVTAANQYAWNHRFVGPPGRRWTRIADDPAHVQAVQ